MKGKFKEANDAVRAKRLSWVVAQHKKDKSPTEIANVLGVSRQRVHQLLREAGVK